jgi:riboflavin synthase
MFSGIIETKQRVLSARRHGVHLQVSVTMPRVWKIKKGDSVAIDGVCSTVVACKSGSFAVEFMQETLEKTAVGDFEKGRIVNLERSMRVGDRLHGHFVQGHVDAVGIVEHAEKGEITIRAPKVQLRHIAYKGSVALNGVSLTVSKKEKSTFSVSLIPFTLDVTNLKLLKEGSEVHIETDMLSRYLDSLRGK